MWTLFFSLTIFLTIAGPTVSLTIPRKRMFVWALVAAVCYVVLAYPPSPSDITDSGGSHMAGGLYYLGAYCLGILGTFGTLLCRTVSSLFDKKGYRD